MSHYLQVPVDEADVNHGYELVNKKDVKKMCFICTISLPMQAFSKRQWQWHNKKGSNSSRKCISCIKKFLSKSGSIGHVLVRDHALSNGLVDGKLHHVSGKIIKDPAMWCQLIDRKVANNLYLDFLSKFRVSSMSVEDIVSFGMNTEPIRGSYSWLQISQMIPSQVTVFMTSYQQSGILKYCTSNLCSAQLLIKDIFGQ